MQLNEKETLSNQHINTLIGVSNLLGRSIYFSSFGTDLKAAEVSLSVDLEEKEVTVRYLNEYAEETISLDDVGYILSTLSLSPS